MEFPVVRIQRLKIFTCDQCPFVTSEKLRLDHHTKSSHQKQELLKTSFSELNVKLELSDVEETPTRKKLISCDKCPYDTKSQKCLQNHQTKKHPPKLINLGAFRSPKNQDGIDEKKDRGESHETDGQTKTFDCVLCDEKFSSKKFLKNHLESIHVKSSTEAFQCCVCSLKFGKKFVLVLHLRTAHGMDKKTAGEIVEEQLAEVDDVKVVDETSGNEIVETVDHEIVEKVDYEFSDDGDIQNDGSFSDDNLSPETFEEASNKNISSKIEKFEESDSEKISSREFRNSESNLKTVPKKIHLKNDSKRFPKKSNEKKLRCNICELKFEDSIDFVGHLERVHPKLPKCVICEKTFNKMFRLRRHLKTVHGILYGSPVAEENATKESQSFFAKEEKCSSSENPAEMSELLKLRRKLRKVVCPVCNESFVGVLKLIRHQKAEHRMVNPGKLYGHLLPIKFSFKTITKIFFCLIFKFSRILNFSKTKNFPKLRSPYQNCCTWPGFVKTLEQGHR